jgi:hypothetical protein
MQMYIQGFHLDPCDDGNVKFSTNCETYIVKKVSCFPVPSLDVTFQNLSGRE